MKLFLLSLDFSFLLISSFLTSFNFLFLSISLNILFLLISCFFKFLVPYINLSNKLIDFIYIYDNENP